MRRYLLDVNVLIALIDPVHVRHSDAHSWLTREGQQGWATCPHTENGVLRIVGNRRYPNSPGTPAVVAESLLSLRESGGHEFWNEDFSLLDDESVQTAKLSDAAKITDTYLLALAALRKGQLATFDRRLVTNTVRGGDRALHVIRVS